jgi:photosystem II stability/assembly factor-like uncharacterized protein
MKLLFSSVLILLSSFDLVPTASKGIVYFSFDNGQTWENKSNGLPDEIFISDMVTAPGFLGISTKQNGLFTFDFQHNRWKSLYAIPSLTNQVDAIYFHKGKIFAGTEGGGVLVSTDGGTSWKSHNEGLQNLTIRKFAAINNNLYAGTNGGLFMYDNLTNKWKLEFDQNGLQVNGITFFNEEIYIGTNRGAFKRKKNNGWKQIMSNYSLHNISADKRNVFALAYNELFISSDGGDSWVSDQQGMPVGMYSFQLVEHNSAVFVGQWDGIYIRGKVHSWKQTNRGLPAKFPAAELAVYEGTLVAASTMWMDE